MSNEQDHCHEKTSAGRGITRRRFIQTMGSGAALVAVSETLVAGDIAQAEENQPKTIIGINLRVNGLNRSLAVEPRWSLLYVLREKLGLTGTKLGCERGECGACTVLIDDIPRFACMTLAVEAQNSEIVTLEGLMQGEQLGTVQQAFAEHDGFQCGYCTPGQIMAAEGLLRENPSPNSAKIRTAMSGNLCRCGAYTHIFKAVGHAAKMRGAKGGVS
jgi:xanthine dehydrogenase YagT iron-sulfur-binding subunit